MSWHDRVTAAAGVGPRAWQRVLEHFGGDREAIMAASPEALAEVRRVGTIRAEAIYRALHDSSQTEVAERASSDLPAELAEFLSSSPYFDGTYPNEESLEDLAREPAPAEHLLLRALAGFVGEYPEAQLVDVLSPEVLAIAEERGLARDLGTTRALEAVTARTAVLLGVNFAPMAEAIASTNPRDRDIIKTRIYQFETRRDTLEEIGGRHDVSRERVRQIQKRLEEQLSTFTDQVSIIAPQVVSLFGLAPDQDTVNTELDSLLGGLPEELRTIAVSALMTAAYLEGEARLLARNLDDVLAKPLRAAQASTRHHVVGMAEAAEVAQLLDGAIDLVGWSRIPKGPFAGRVLDKHTKLARVGAGLWLLGEPATKEQIAEAAGYDADEASRISSTLTNIPDIVRADIDSWGYMEWVDDVYDGIATEILQRVEAAGGSALLDEVVSDILDTFSVSESSVRTYAMSDQFFVVNGRITVARPEAVTVATDAWNVEGAIETEHGWAQPVTIEQRHFDGYSFLINKKVAGANGLRPSDSLVVPLEGTNHQVSVIWRLTALNGVDVGRVAAPLCDLHMDVGDVTYVCATPDRVWLIPSDEIPETDAETEILGHLDDMGSLL